MKTYDQYAIQDLPELLLSSPLSTNQGAGIITLGAVPSTKGQPIISGSEWSFRVNGTDQITINKNDLFYVEGSTLECVVYFHTPPVAEVPIIAEPNKLMGLFANNDGIFLRLAFDDGTMSLPIETLVPINDWSRKYYITVSFGELNATIAVNDQTETIEYNFPTVTPASSLVIGAGNITDWFLLDGLGVYNKSFTKKLEYVDDLDNGHKQYVSQALKGISTEFDTRIEEWALDVPSSDFSYVGLIEEKQYSVVCVQLPQGETPVIYISVKASDERIVFEYSYDGGATWISFRDQDTISNSAEYKQLAFRHVVYDRFQSDDDDFSLRLVGISDGSIEYMTPAKLVLTGGVIYPREVNDSIVNCHDGAYLDNAYYDGSWINPVKTIEIVFKPEEEPASGYLEIFQATDGYVRWGPGSKVINGFSAVLNGVSASNTNDVRMGQWNHLVLRKSSNVTDFSINKNNPRLLSLLSLAGYTDELTNSQAIDLYKVLYGGDNLFMAESCGVVNEAVYAETGTAFKLYSYNWAVVGSTVT